MLPRLRMLAKKISIACAAGALIGLTVVISGCTPAGPRALLEGKKLLDDGDYVSACTQLNLAATLMKTNAIAWNYLGVAEQRAGQPTEAANAYSRALELDRDLVEAHFNLGCLYLEQNQADLARTELTSYLLRRPNDPDAWDKLGSAQLRLGDTTGAEKSFSAVLALKPKEKDAEAYNGLGVACVQRRHYQDATRWFAAAVALQPDFAPAVLNLATTFQKYLRDNRSALAWYHNYLTLSPRPADWDAVNAIVAGLEPAGATPMAPAPVAAPVAATLSVTSAPVAVAGSPLPPTSSSHPAPVVRSNPPPTQPAAGARQPVSSGTGPNSAPQVVRLSPEPAIVIHAGQTPPPAPAPAGAKPFVLKPVGTYDESTLEVHAEDTPKKGFWQRLKPVTWFGGDAAETNATSAYGKSGVTPLATPAETRRPAQVILPFTPVTRYQYLSPARPATGDHRSASGAFTKAQLYEQDENWADAMYWFGQASNFDPAWFEAHYNEAVLAQRIRNYSHALTSYEWALAIQPGSVDARYNFALALKAAGHPVDAANELKKIVAANGNEVRAHLALGNLYAQSLHEPVKARQEYSKVLELDPENAQAASVRSWLNSN